MIRIAHCLLTIKDANCIYVIGEGAVLEMGKHDELLSNEAGPYICTVQRLYETHDAIDLDDVIRQPSRIAVQTSKKVAQEEIPLELPPVLTLSPIGGTKTGTTQHSSKMHQYGCTHA